MPQQRSPKKSIQTIKIAGNKENLAAELARSRIYQAVADNLAQLGVRPGGTPGAWDWSLDFDLHFGLDVPVDQDVAAQETQG